MTIDPWIFRSILLAVVMICAIFLWSFFNRDKVDRHYTGYVVFVSAVGVVASLWLIAELATTLSS